MIMVIVITGIIAGMVAVFITKPVQGYVDSVRRAELTDAADVAMRRMTRDVRLALPNSLRTVTNGFEFIMTKSGGRYRADGDGSGSAGNFLSFTDTGDLTFDVLGPMPAMEAGDRFVVYNLGENYSPADAYSGGNVATIGGTGVITANPVTLTPSNPFASQSPPLPSPSARFQIVDKDELVVRYVCDGHRLMRIAGCTLVASPACGAGSLLAGALTGEPTATCTIDYTSAAAGRNGLLYIQLTLTQSGESVTLFQQIHVDNSP
jgi:MSHA biogenesis protein MshO